MSTPDATPTVGDRLGVAVGLAVASRPAPLDTLSPAERARLDTLPTETRRRDWLLGRAALKALVGAAFDTTAVEFPHRRLSLTHAGGTAFAAMAGGDVLGTGVDFEPARATVDLRIARFFLGPAERAAASTGGDLLRLWTVKEALFKATPGNHRVVLADYTLDDPAGAHGSATGPQSQDLRYATVAAAGGVLTVAVCRPRRRHRAAV